MNINTTWQCDSASDEDSSLTWGSMQPGPLQVQFRIGLGAVQVLHNHFLGFLWPPNCNHLKRPTYFFFSHWFSPTGPIWSSSCDVCLYVTCMCVVCPLPMPFLFKASHWPSDHMISSRPLFGSFVFFLQFFFFL